jgi:hypothetical protein
MKTQMTLGSFIDALKKLDNYPIKFDITYHVPTTFDSYSGCDCALGMTNLHSELPKVNDILEESIQCLDTIFEGYKGGIYRMDEHTNLWVANSGESTGIAITGLELNDDNEVVILTEMLDYE